MTADLDDDTLVRIATEHARSAGRRVERYEAFKPQLREGRWRVLFHAPNGPPGDHFEVELDASDGTLVAIHPGE